MISSHKNNALTLTSALCCGFLFGTGMVFSGMVDPGKVQGFLDVTGKWDPSLAFVMVGAIGVFAPVYHLVIRRRSCALNGFHIAQPGHRQITLKLVGGAALFGIGWGLAGICPGPALTALGSGLVQPLIFVVGLMAGLYGGGLITKQSKQAAANHTPS
ncbi:YeeE/YedE family protein [Parasalinivibrio latis]|uniref:DUF6691 family protein n=1 Tax=Parasalinivibrio latis TaxID=2952610 RepID=UPI0030E3A43D